MVSTQYLHLRCFSLTHTHLSTWFSSPLIHFSLSLLLLLWFHLFLIRSPTSSTYIVIHSHSPTWLLVPFVCISSCSTSTTTLYSTPPTPLKKDHVLAIFAFTGAAWPTEFFQVFVFLIQIQASFFMSSMNSLDVLASMPIQSWLM